MFCIYYISKGVRRGDLLIGIGLEICHGGAMQAKAP